MIKTYKIKSEENKNKTEKIKDVLNEYRKAAKKIAKLQWYNFNLKNKFNKQSKINIDSKLSARYLQTCQYQVVGLLESYYSNKKNEFRDTITKSKLSDERRKELYQINRSYDRSKFPEETQKLYRKIMKHLIKRKPNLSKINMNLDEKVAKISNKINQKAVKYDYWIKLSTLEAGKPILIPIVSNGYYEEGKGIQKRFSQINLDKDNNLSLCFIKEEKDYKKLSVDEQRLKYVSKVDKIGLDFGLNNLFASSTGNLYGRNFKEPIEKMDKIIVKIAKNRQRQGLKVRSKRYDKLVNKLKSYIKNEVNRVLNQLIKKESPREIVVERLNFQSPKLSKRMNRILSNYGKKVINDKFKRLTEELGIICLEINPAYTSQECSSCGYIDKENRKKQSKFLCLCCGLKLNADINASRVIYARSSCISSNVFLNRKTVLKIRLDLFTSNFSLRHPYYLSEDDPRHYRLATFLESNRYFNDLFQD
jgi:putative transposase